MKRLFGFLVAMVVSFPVLASDKGGLPSCKAELNDDLNTPVARLDWKEDLYMGSVSTPTRGILITTSLGNNQVMSLWVRDKQNKPNGMFSFVDLSSGKDQYLRFYMDDGYSLGVTCRWEADSRN